MESFNTDQSVEQEQTQDQKVTFKVGDREYDPEAAAKKISSADEHIQRIEAENAELRARAEKALTEDQVQAKIEEALQKLNASKPESRSEEPTSSFDPEKLSTAAREAALQALQEEREKEQAMAAKQTQEQLFKETQARLAAVYGDKIDEAIAEKTGIPLADALQMAKHPTQSKVLLKALGIDEKSKPSLSPSGSVNTVSLGRTSQPKSPFEGKDRITNKDIIDALLQRSQ